MTPQHLKNSLLQNWQSCRDAVCNATAKTGDKTKALLRDWKHAGQLVCVGVAATAFVLISATTPAHSQTTTYDLRKLNIPYGDNIGGGAISLNAKGIVVGTLNYFQPNIDTYGSGFIYDVAAGAIKSYIHYGTDTYIDDINDNGAILGDYGTLDSEGNLIAWSNFIYKNGGASFFKVPLNRKCHVVSGINNNGDRVGWYGTSEECYWDMPSAGFVYRNGSYSSLTLPGAGSIHLNSINDNGVIVGLHRYAYGYGDYGFLYSNGVPRTLKCDDGTLFIPYKINNAGQILGFCPYIDEWVIYQNGAITERSTTTQFISINNKGQILQFRCDPPNNQSNCSYYLASPKIPVPVIVIPGIAGSMSSCLFVDPASGEACREHYDFDYALIKTIPLTPDWVLDPTVEHVYDSLVQELRNSGTPVYEMPYDWRKKNEDTAKTLSDLVERAKRETGSKKVDIVAHSMGGLVSRYYIEKVQKTANVRKLVMLGTPNRGSCNAYYSWEGADFSKSGFKAHRLFFDFLIRDMKIGYHQIDTGDAVFVRTAVPALQQLLPVDSYLYKENKQGNLVRIPISKMDEDSRNYLVPQLNNSNLIKKLGVANIQIFAGNTEDTIGSIVVDTFNTSVYADGFPVRTLDPVPGDGTVPLVSARLGASGVKVFAVDAEHTELPDTCRANVVRFLSGEALQPATAVTTEEMATQRMPINSNLFLGTAEKINMGLTTPDGRRFGKFPFEETKVIEVDNPYYRGDNEHTAALGMGNPSAGEYSLKISTRELPSDYKILVSYTDENGKDIEHVLKGTVTRDDVQTYRIKINGATLDIK